MQKTDGVEFVEYTTACLDKHSFLVSFYLLRQTGDRLYLGKQLNEQLVLAIR
jgi:hypothetical protein